MSGASNSPKDILEQLRSRFHRFRGANELRTRVPDELRQAAVHALAQGVSKSALRRACGLSGKQLTHWQLHPVANAQYPSERARVFEIAEDTGVAETATADKVGSDGALELRLGEWAITIRSGAV